MKLSKPTFSRDHHLTLPFHAACLAWYILVWVWHCTPEAAYLPGYSGYGWFFRYLTFCSFTLQLITLLLSTLDGITKLVHKCQSTRWTNISDDLSCALFALAHVVTIMFHVIQYSTKSAVEGKQRPAWLNMSMHVFNSGLVWSDLLISTQRTFSERSQKLSILIVVSYSCWLYVQRHVTGVYPYPFLNKMPHPKGFLIIISAGVTLFVLMFKLGRMLNRHLQNGLGRGPQRVQISLVAEARTKHD